MAITEVGVPLTTQQSTGNGTPKTQAGAWNQTGGGNNQNRTAGNLLVALVTAAGTTSAGTITENSAFGWQEVAQDGGTYVKSAIFTLTATGGDTAPTFQSTIAGTASRCRMSVMLYELTDSGGTVPAVDTSGHNLGTSGTLDVATAANVAATGEFAVASQVCLGTSSGANTWGAVGSFAQDGTDGATTYNHWVAASLASPASGSALHYNPTHSFTSTGTAGAIAVFKPGAPPARTGTGALVSLAMTASGAGLAGAIGTGALAIPAPAAAGSGSVAGGATAGPPLFPPNQALGGRAYWARPGHAQASAIPLPAAAAGTGALAVPAATAAGSGNVVSGIAGTGGLTLPAAAAAGTGQAGPCRALYAGATAAAGNPVTVTQSSQAGDAIAVWVSAGATITGVSDSAGNTYVQIGYDNANFDALFVATYHGSPGTPTVGLAAGAGTITVSGTFGTDGAVLAVAGQGISAVAADKAPAWVNQTTQTPSGPATGAMTQAGDLVLCGYAGGTGVAAAAWGSGFVTAGAVSSGSGGIAAGWLVAPSTASVTPSATLGANLRSSGFTVALAPSGTITGTGNLAVPAVAVSGSGTAGTAPAPVPPLAQPAGLWVVPVRAGNVQFTWPAPAPPPAAVTGTGNLTVPAAVLAGSGISGTATTGPPLSSLTQAAGGRAYWARPGHAQATAIPAVAAAVTGTGNLTVPALAAAGSGAEEFAGGGTPSLPRATAAGSGNNIEGTGGSGGLTVPLVTFAGTGAEAFTGTGTLPSSLLAASGTGAEGFTGTGSLTLPAAVVAGSGTVSAAGTSGSGALAVPAPTVSGAGLAGAIGTGALASLAVTVSGTGAEEFTGTGAPVVPRATASGSGNVIEGLGGSGGLTVPRLSFTGTGTEAFTGTGALTSLAATVSGSGSVAGAVTGTGALALTRVTAAGSGSQVFITGSGALTSRPLTATGAGLAGAIGAGTVTLPVFTASGAGAEAFTGTGALRLLALTVTGEPPPVYGTAATSGGPAGTGTGGGGPAGTGTVSEGAAALATVGGKP